MSKAFGAAIKESRIAAALSQAEVAEKLSVSQVTISNWEIGKFEPSQEQRSILEKVLGLSAGKATIANTSPAASWLTKARLALRLSVPELADKSGISYVAIYNIEAGRTRNIRESTRKKLESALGARLPPDAAKEIREAAEISGLGALEDFDPHMDSERPLEPGIYVLYDISDRPVYVGEAANVRKRIKDHEEKFWFKRPIVETASWIKIVDSKLRTQIETLLIKFLKSNAVLNKQNVDR